MTERSKDAMKEHFFSVQGDRKSYVKEKKLYQLEIMLTDRCAGGCNYCVIFSTPTCSDFLTKERLIELIDEAVDLQLRAFQWAGGDPLLHPDWHEIISYSLERGLNCGIWNSGLISKENARRLFHLYRRYPHQFEVLGIHIDTINQEAYNQINAHPQTLEQKIQGYRNILETGFPPEKVMPSPTLTRPVCDTIEETIDWFVDEMGVKEIAMCPFRARGLGDRKRGLEPGLSDIKKANEYVARKLGQDWLEIGGTPLGTLYCRSSACIWANGDLLPCGVMYDLVMGNIYRETVGEILEKHRDTLLFTGQIKGPCGKCRNNDVCIGCRANAYSYLGDLYASDPKCWLNPEAKERYYLTA